MVRIVFSGVYDRYPGLKLIVHHHGALVPSFAQRMQYGWDYFEQSTGVKQQTTISRPYIYHFRKFYCDTATQGREPSLIEAAVRFRPEHVLFGLDAPMDATGGLSFTRDAIASVAEMGSHQDRRTAFSGRMRSACCGFRDRAGRDLFAACPAIYTKANRGVKALHVVSSARVLTYSSTLRCPPSKSNVNSIENLSGPPRPHWI